MIYMTHIASHINFHSTNGKYKCKICEEEGQDLTNVSIHVEQLHSKRRSQDFEADNVRKVERKNLEEKEEMVFKLSKSDTLEFPLKTPY